MNTNTNARTNANTNTNATRLDDVDEARDMLEQLCEEEGREIPFLQVCQI